MVLAAGGLELDLAADTLAGDDDIGETAVLDLGEARLLADVYDDKRSQHW